MATFESTKFIPFVFPPSNKRSCNNGSLLPAITSRSSHLVSNQRIRGPAASSHSGSQVEVDRYAAARVEGRKRALTASDDESDDDFPSLEELTQAALRPQVLAKSSKTGSTLQFTEQSALQRAGSQIDQAQFGPSGDSGGSRDQPVILDNDDDLGEAGAGGEAKKVASKDLDTRRIERNASLHATFATSELSSAPTEFIDAPGSWDDVKQPAPGLGPPEEHSVLSVLAQAQSQTLPQCSAPHQDQTNQQDVSNVARSASVEPAPYSLPKPSDSGDDGWTDEDTAELEKELGLALEEHQVKSLSTSAPTSPSSRSVEAPHDETKSRKCTETTCSRPEELQDASQHDTAQDFQGWEQQETEIADGEGVAMREQEQEERAEQKKELEQPLVGDQQVVDADDPKDKEATESLPPTQPETDEHRFRLRGIRARQLPGRQTKTTQYRVVWGQRPNRSDSWVNEDDTRMSVPWPPCELYSQNLAPSIDIDIVRVCKMRSSGRKGTKVFEYLVDAFGLENSTWITEDQLKISFSPILALELKGSSPHPLSETQRDVLLRHSATLIRDEHGYASRASRSSSALVDPALEGEPATRKRRHQDTETGISSDNHHSANTEDNRDTDDEEPRPAKRRKPRSSPAVTPPPHVRRSCRFESTSTTSLEIDDMQPQADDRHHYTPPTLRSSSASIKSAPIAEYQEWPFKGFVKRTRVGNETTYNFQLSHVPEHLHLSILSETLGMRSTSAEAVTPHNPAVHSEVQPIKLRGKRKRVLWKPEENERILDMKREGCSWEEIHRALPNRTSAAIQVQYCTKLKN